MPGNSNFFSWDWLHTLCPLLLEHLREKAVHALFILRRRIDFSSLKPSLACKIFDTTISPILTYNWDAWDWSQSNQTSSVLHLLKKVTCSFVNALFASANIAHCCCKANVRESSLQTLKSKRRGLKGKERPLTMTCLVRERYFRSAANRNGALYTVLDGVPTLLGNSAWRPTGVKEHWTFLTQFNKGTWNSGM